MGQRRLDHQANARARQPEPDRAEHQRGDQQHGPRKGSILLTDGGVYDNLAVEPVWKTYKTQLVSDAGRPFESVFSSGQGITPHVVLKIRTTTGKVLYAQRGKRHGMIKRTTKQIRQLRGTNVLFKTDGDNIKKYFLPNG